MQAQQTSEILFKTRREILYLLSDHVMFYLLNLNTSLLLQNMNGFIM